MTATPAFAQDASFSKFSVSGYGTVGAAHSDSDESDYIPNPTLQPDGVGRSTETSLAPDSKMGVQVDYKFSDRLSVSGQILSKQFTTDKFEPQLEMAFAKFALTSNLDLRAGRLRLPLYLLSDSLDVNYANAWVRPPQEFYASGSLTRYEGADLLWRTKVGKVSFLVQPYGGGTSVVLPGGATRVVVNNILGLNVSAMPGDFVFRIGYLRDDLTVYSAAFDNGVLPALRAICNIGDQAACAQLIEQPTVDEDSSFTTFSAAYDNGTYFGSAELGMRDQDSELQATAWYVSGGTRVGKWTPYATYSATERKTPTTFTAGTFPGGGGLPSTNAFVTSLRLSSAMDQSTITLGLRRELWDNVAIKGQYDRVSTQTKNGQAGTGKGLFKNTTSAFNNRDNDVNLLSVSIDFVF
jgi:hypothetical protein